jgi:restriction system protein
MVKEIPSFSEFTHPVLKLLADGKEYKTKEIREKMYDHFEFSDEQKRKLLPSGKSVVTDRCSWALTFLKKAELVESITDRYGYCKITKKGLDVANNKNIKQLGEKELCDLSDALYEERKKKKRGEEKNDTKKEPLEIDDLNTQNKVSVESLTPDESLDNAYQKIRNKLIEELLEKFRNITPEVFERLVLKLLEKMGYGKGENTKRGADGGIDGIINQDKLGLDKIYIQAKRWNENKVSRPEIDKFVGVLAREGIKKGVFITASDFAGGVEVYETTDETKIVLINGKKLANLMIDYNLGVSLEQSYEIKRLDNDYFDEL